jgi:hypothetical protein
MVSDASWVGPEICLSSLDQPSENLVHLRPLHSYHSAVHNNNGKRNFWLGTRVWGNTKEIRQGLYTAFIDSVFMFTKIK